MVLTGGFKYSIMYSNMNTITLDLVAYNINGCGVGSVIGCTGCLSLGDWDLTSSLC